MASANKSANIKFAPDYFDKKYYQKYYHNPKTRVNSQKSILTLGAFVASYIKFLDGDINKVLDLGCGVGHWKKVTSRQWKKASYVGVEYSSYLCEKYGWKQASIAEFKSRHKFDLIICQGVLQYLSDKEASKALKNIHSLSRAFLYLECLTKRDWEKNCDVKQSDGKVFLRSENWYRNRLKNFLSLGGGLFVNKKYPLNFFDLERPG